MHKLNNFLNSVLPFLAYIWVLNSCSNPDSNDTRQEILSLDSLANKAYENEDYKNAIVLFDSLVSADSTRGELYYKRGYAHMMSRDKISLDSLNDGTREEYLELKERAYNPAINDFLKTIDLGHKKSKAYLNLGVIYTFLNDSIAWKYFNKSLQEDPNYEKAKHQIELCEDRLRTNEHFY
jgi:hypothetical protein